MIVHTVASLDQAGGGIPRSAIALASQLARNGREIAVLRVEAEKGGDRPMLSSGPKTLRLHRGDGSRYVPNSAVSQLESLRVTSRVELVHDHGLWLPMHHGIAAWCRRCNVPRVVSIRGMLNPWARRHHATRKFFAWVAFQRADLAAADVLHATSEAEVEAIRTAGMLQPVVLLPNGIAPPIFSPRATTEPSGRRTALFLSRLHPSKGIDLLLQAWRDASPRGWRLVIAGAGSVAFVRWIDRSIGAFGLRETVSLHGPVDDRLKWDLYAGADLFLLPSRSENFGIVVAEALATGLPVITTHAAPWEWLPARQAGWWVPVDATKLADAIRTATACAPDELQAMGRRGRSEALIRFDWRTIAGHFAAVYAWILGRGPAPACVRVSGL